MRVMLGQVGLRSTWAPSRLSGPRLGQRDWTPIEAEAWVKQVTPALREFPDCRNTFFDRARQIVDALRTGAAQYDDLITITEAEWNLKAETDACLAANRAAAKTRDERTEMVAIIGGLAVAIGVIYWAFA